MIIAYIIFSVSASSGCLPLAAMAPADGSDSEEGLEEGSDSGGKSGVDLAQGSCSRGVRRLYKGCTGRECSLQYVLVNIQRFLAGHHRVLLDPNLMGSLTTSLG